MSKTLYLVARRKKNPTCSVYRLKPNTTQSRISSYFLVAVWLDRSIFQYAKLLKWMATAVPHSLGKTGKNAATKNEHPSYDFW
jgi:hypothetical protein